MPRIRRHHPAEASHYARRQRPRCRRPGFPRRRAPPVAEAGTAPTLGAGRAPQSKRAKPSRRHTVESHDEATGGSFASMRFSQTPTQAGPPRLLPFPATSPPPQRTILIQECWTRHDAARFAFLMATLRDSELRPCSMMPSCRSDADGMISPPTRFGHI